MSVPSMPESAMRQVLGGLPNTETPRWHTGKLWFTVGRARQVRTVTMDGVEAVVAQFDDSVGGLGFLEDGTLLVVQLRTRRIAAVDPNGAIRIHADLTHLGRDFLNDMVVYADGRAYVGVRSSSIGPFQDYDLSVPGPDAIALVEPDGSATIAIEGVTSPNGMVITPDGATLIAAQTYDTRRLLAFDRSPDGSLSGQRLYAETGEAFPDGIALDAEGCVWCASPFTNETVRVAPGGECTMRVVTPTGTPMACMLGGDDRRMLFVVTADPSAMPAPGSRDPSFKPSSPKPPSDEVLSGGSVYAMPVDVPGAGWP